MGANAVSYTAIGFTLELASRVKNLQPAVAAPVVILADVDGTGRGAFVEGQEPTVVDWGTGAIAVVRAFD
ncbi:MAG: hypothetical protein PVH41_16190 [Anaerolineae bacterium]|jgi:hypothetical protein